MTADPKQDKQITVEVPADRVPEFYAFYGRFLAGVAGRRGHGGGRGRGRRCGGHGHHSAERPGSGPETQTA
jgi:hypothetical protein